MESLICMNCGYKMTSDNEFYLKTGKCGRCGQYINSVKKRIHVIKKASIVIAGVLAVSVILFFLFIPVPFGAKAVNKKTVTLGEIRQLKPLCGEPVFVWTENNELNQKSIERMGGLAKYFDSLPGNKDQKDKWTPAMTMATGVDLQSKAVNLLIHLNQRMGIMFNDDNTVKADVYDRLAARLKTIEKVDLEKWQPSANRIYGEDVSPVDVAISILSVEELYAGNQYDSGLADRYLQRVESVTKEDVDLWVAAVPVFEKTRLDALMRIMLIDDFFSSDNFDREFFKKVLNGESS